MMNYREVVITGMCNSGINRLVDLMDLGGMNTPSPLSLTAGSLNSEILKNLNSFWDQLDTHKLARIKEYHISQKSLLQMEKVVQQSLKNGEQLCLADPKFSITFYFWLQFFVNPLIIVCVRNPLDIAKTLKMENGFSLEKGLRLWECYTWMLLRFISPEQCVFVYYDHLANREKICEQLWSQLVENGVRVKNEIKSINPVAFEFIENDSSECSDDDMFHLLSPDQRALWARLNKLNPSFQHYKKKETSIKKRIVGKIKTANQLLTTVTSIKKANALWSAYKALNSNNTFFSKKFYLRENPDVEQEGLSPLIHYLTCGWQEGRNPNRYFDTDYYFKEYPDIKEATINPLYHFVTKGWKENRNPSQYINLSDQFIDNPYLSDKQVHPLEHLDNDGVSVKGMPSLGSAVYFKQYTPVFEKKITIIIPVYLSNEQAVAVFDLLIRSIVSSYAVTNEYLQFLVIDDQSPFREIENILVNTKFSERPDVTLIQNEVNIGFVKTVNKGFSLASKDSDIVILNSDTEIHGPIFENLQSLCLRYPKIASVTPLSNRATIACLKDWPLGADSIYNLSSKQIAQVINTAGLVSPNSYTPTGHGFCMYMSHEAMKEVGGFDEESFADGYGEENDWSVRAIQKGFKHLISTECYVHHYESMSFSSDKKNELQKINKKTLLKKHPSYDNWVHNYLRNDSLGQHRKVLQILLLEIEKKKCGIRTICFLLHDSYKNHHGGVQQHLRQLINTMSVFEELEIIIISPTEIKSEFYDINFSQKNEKIILEKIDKRSLLNILKQFNGRIDFLHLHSFFGLADDLIDWVREVKVDTKLFTIHDYQLFCENPFMLNKFGKFCLEDNTINSCDMKCRNILDNASDLLNIFDEIFVPSENCYRYVKRLLTVDKSRERITVFPHFLSYFEKASKQESKKPVGRDIQKNIVFLGSLFPHKGGELFLSNINELKGKGFNISVWGHVQEELINKHDACFPVFTFRNWKELLELQGQYGAYIIVMPSICAETFSYTFYEALLLLETPVIVGAFGHPADVVRDNGVGEVVEKNSSLGLLKAIHEVDGNYSLYKDNIVRFKENELPNFDPTLYVERYLKHLFGEQYTLPETNRIKQQGSAITLSLQGKAIMNSAATSKGRKKLNVLMIHSLSSGNPPYFYRFENPIAFLNNSECSVSVCDMNSLDTNIELFDAIYLSRTPCMMSS